MILFFVGIIEMAVATLWTRSVNRASARLTGLVTAVNFTIWYFIIRQVVENIAHWEAIVPYGLGCVVGSMLTVKFNLDLQYDRLGNAVGALFHKAVARVRRGNVPAGAETSRI